MGNLLKKKLFRHIKKIVFAVAILQNLLLCYNIFAQSSEIPHNLTVSINPTTNLAELKWKITAPEIVVGYLIKRKIYDFPNVVPNSFQTIAEISGGTTLSFTDTTSSYGVAEPLQLIQYYRIISISIINGKRYLSPMSEIGNSILPTAQFDLCTKSTTISWNSFPNFMETNVQLFFVENNQFVQIGEVEKSVNSMVHEKVKLNTNYQYICSTGVAPNQIFSAKFSFFTQTEEEAQFANIESLFTENYKRKIVCKVDQKPATTAIQLFSSQQKNLNFNKIAELTPNGSGNQTFLIQNQNFKQVLYYFVRLENKCGQAVLFSDTVFVPTLSAKYSEQKNIVSLSLSSEFNENKTELFRNSSTTNDENIGLFVFNSFADNIEDLLVSQLITGNQEIEICYFAQIYKAGKLFSNTNTVCVNPGEIMLIPNAFQPNSRNKIDRVFRPQAAFVQHYSMKIYSLWGDLIFTSYSLTNGWNGNLKNGSRAAQQSYYYIITYSNSENQNLIRKGFVTLLD